MNKKALSTIIATLLIISMTIVAGILVANFLIPFVQNNLDSSSVCLPYRNYFTFDEQNTNCIDNTKKMANVAIRAGVFEKSEDGKDISDKIIGIELGFTNLTAGKQVIIDSASVDVRAPSGGAVNIPKDGGFRLYNITLGLEKINKVEMRVILKSRTCAEASDTITLEVCS